MFFTFPCQTMTVTFLIFPTPFYSLATPTHPLSTSNLKASKFPSKAAQSVGVIPSSSFALQSFLVASLSASRYPSRAALETAGLRRPVW